MVRYMTDEKINMKCKNCGEQLTKNTRSVSLPNWCSSCFKKLTSNQPNFEKEYYKENREEYLRERQLEFEAGLNYCPY